MGRRFRSLKLWLVLRTYGLEGIRSYLRHHCELAAWFASRVQESEIFELAAPPRLGLVCFRLKAAAGETPEASSAKTAKLVERVNARGRVSVTSARLGGEVDGRCIVRVAIGGSDSPR